VSTVYSKDNGSIIINVVNRHKEKAITTEIINQTGNFTGKPVVNEVNASDLNENFSFDKQQQYVPATKDATIKGNKIVYSFPPHSFTQIIVKVN
jgi:alpha-N-arabinofuranosidase